MELRYVAVYKIRGSNGLSGDDSSLLSEIQSPKLVATLTANPEPWFEHIDRAKALGTQILSGLFSEKKEGTPAERLTAGVEIIKADRKAPEGVYVAFEGEGDFEPPEFKARRDTDEFGIVLDDLSKSELRKPFKSTIEGVLSAVALGLPEQADKRIEEIGSVLYLVDPDKKIPVYAFNFDMGGASAYISSPIGADFVREVTELAVPLASDKALERPVRLLLSSLYTGVDSLPAFISAWSALEIFINATFKACYEAKWFDIMEEGAPTSSTPIFERLKDVMKDKYRIVDKFLVITAVLDAENATTDVESFKSLKSVRDNMFHKFDTLPKLLPTEDVQKLFKKYLKLHLLSSLAKGA